MIVGYWDLLIRKEYLLSGKHQKKIISIKMYFLWMNIKTILFYNNITFLRKRKEK